MSPTDAELAAARECLARLADYAGGDDYLSASGVRQNVEAVQAVIGLLGTATPSDSNSGTRRPHDIPTDTSEPRTVQLTRWALAEGGTVGRLAVLELLAEYDGLRAVLARPAGRDLTGDDIDDALAHWGNVFDVDERYVADRLNEIARGKGSE